jgi:hypothetical protein
MATLCRAKDGHWFVRKGFPIHGASDEGIFATYQISPKGLQIIEYTDLRDGDQLGRSLFYSLYLDGGLLRSGDVTDISIYDLPDDLGPSPVQIRGQWTEIFAKYALMPRLSIMGIIRDLDEIHSANFAKKTSKTSLLALAVEIFLGAKAKEEEDRLRYGIQ